MRSRLTARQMYERWLDGDSVRIIACDAYGPDLGNLGDWVDGPGRAYALRVEDVIRRSCRKAMMKGTR
jgi:hypothetical protein